MASQKPENWFFRVKGLVFIQAFVTVTVVGLGWGWDLVRVEWAAVMSLMSGLLLAITLFSIRHLREVEKDLEDGKNKAEKERELQRVMLSSIGEGVVVLDTEAKVRLLNQAACKMLGWKMEEAIGKDWDIVAPLMDEQGNLIDKSKRATKRVLEEGIVLTNNKNCYVDKGGRVFSVGTTAAPIVIEGKTTGVIAIFRDITHDKAVDRAKSEFVSLASHQLRTPLSAIKWFTELLASGDVGEMTPEQKQFLENIYSSNERMIELVNGLLNISRIESGRIIIDPKLTDLGVLVKQIINDLVAQVSEKKLEMIVSLHPNLPQMNVDSKLVAQVYMNLLTNAVKYTPAGGQIEVMISLKGDEVLSRVSDTGYGIPPDDQKKIFERFYRAGNAVKMVPDGTGLGLYLAKTIVESSGGRIWFESEVGKGSTFWFTLPLTGMQAKSGEVRIS